MKESLSDWLNLFSHFYNIATSEPCIQILSGFISLVLYGTCWHFMVLLVLFGTFWRTATNQVAMSMNCSTYLSALNQPCYLRQYIHTVLPRRCKEPVSYWAELGTKAVEKEAHWYLFGLSGVLKASDLNGAWTPLTQWWWNWTQDRADSTEHRVSVLCHQTCLERLFCFLYANSTPPRNRGGVALRDFQCVKGAQMTCLRWQVPDVRWPPVEMPPAGDHISSSDVSLNQMSSSRESYHWYHAGTQNPYELKPSNVNFADKAVSVMTPKGFCFVLLSSE